MSLKRFSIFASAIQFNTVAGNTLQIPNTSEGMDIFTEFKSVVILTKGNILLSQDKGITKEKNGEGFHYYFFFLLLIIKKIKYYLIQQMVRCFN